MQMHPTASHNAGDHSQLNPSMYYQTSWLIFIGQWVASGFVHLVFDSVVKEGGCVSVLLQVEIMILKCFGEQSESSL